jgi:glycosyltransferase involved in cell wall biosynthesis
VLAVSPVGEAGGAEVLLVGVLAGLADAGSDVTLLVLGEGPLESLARSHGVPLVKGPAFSLRRPRSFALAAAAVRRELGLTRPLVVLSSHPKAQIVSRLACLGARGLTHVTQLYDPPAATCVSARLAACLRGLRLAITEETAASYRRWRPAQDPVVIPPGLDLAALRGDAGRGDGDAAWERAGMGSRRPRVVMVGRLQRFKGALDLLEAATAVLARVPEALFLIIGPDSPIEPTLGAALRTEIELRGLGRSVAVAGRLDGGDLAATMRDADLLVHPAARDPFGLVLVESLALGTPVVAYASSGPASILGGTGAPGALVPVGDVDALADAVAGALSDRSVMTAWERSASRVAARYDVGAVVDRYLALLSHAAGATSWPAMVTSIGVVPPGPSGVRDYGRLLAEELERSGVEVAQRWLESDGVRMATAATMSGQLLRLAVTLPRGGVALWHYSPVRYGYRGLPGFGVLLGVLLRLRGCRVVSVLHELAYTYRPGLDRPAGWVRAQVQRIALRAVLAGSNEVVVTTDRRHASLQSQNRWHGERVHLVPVFPTIPRWEGPAPGGDGRFVVGVLGYSGDGVRPDLLLKAVRALGPPEGLRLVLLGAPGPGSPDGQRWRRLAEEEGVAGSLDFTGVVSPDEFGRRLAGCTVVALVNEEGPSSRKTTLAVALAQGLPVVSIDGYNRWERLAEAQAVRLVPSDADALGRALVELRDNPLARASLGKRGADFAAEHMSVTAAAEVFAPLLYRR